MVGACFRDGPAGLGSLCEERGADLQFCEAEIARLTEEIAALVAYIELIDPKRDWRIEEIEKMRNEPEVREGRLAIQPILARHREEGSR